MLIEYAIFGALVGLAVAATVVGLRRRRADVLSGDPAETFPYIGGSSGTEGTHHTGHTGVDGSIDGGGGSQAGFDGGGVSHGGGGFDGGGGQHH